MSDEPRDCENILAHSASAIRPLIRSQVNHLPAHIRHITGMHFGWWTDDRIHLDRPAEGKALRPALALLACQAVGGAPEQARLAAVAVELIHNASLLHDDIIDHDPVRRHRPALWPPRGFRRRSSPATPCSSPPSRLSPKPPTPSTPSPSSWRASSN
ncbi:polyprenyl synthetase family protein [Streptomyces sp. NPDC056835]|uniref:polyprenyl synthetase family protein n=1 Tax=Streptomyces sp. NPDC056835 TaxID=3345956 RepID=UPI00368B5E40